MRAFSWLLLCACALASCACAGADEACACAGDLLDCSSREKTSLPSAEVCSGASKANLYNNNLRDFPRGLQEGYIEVDVSFNRLTALPAPSLVDARMAVLRLAGNDIGNATDELRGLSHLRTLDLSDNRLTTLQFLPLQCALRELDVSENRLVSLDGPLKDCAQLESLILTDNKLKRLSESVFARMSQLRELDLRQNHLPEAGSNVFRGLRQLEYLDLRSNQLAILHNEAFNGLENLKTIHLSSNPLRVVSDSAFHGLSAVENLHLSDTSLSTLPEEAFRGLVQLKTLNLNGNKLTSLASGVFATLRSLEDVQLQGNRLRELPRGLFAGLERVQQLLLERNQLSELARGVFRPLARLATLDLDGNRLQTLRAGTFAGLHALRRLSLRYNRLAALPALHDCCAGLRLASFRHNNLTAVDEAAARALLRLGADVDVRNNQLTAEGVRWAAEAGDLQAAVTEGVCACGRVLAGGAGGAGDETGPALYLCVDVPCGVGERFHSWVDAVRRRNQTQA